MQTEFTCGIYSVQFTPANHWDLNIHPHTVGTIEPDGSALTLYATMMLPVDNLIEIAVLMNNIKRQYKQHANTANT
jgi:predicted tellurium resistance membrane protein TerC